MTFWEHLDELRSRLWRILVMVVIAMVLCFFFKEQLFAIVLGPKPEYLQLINVELTQQFLIHMRVALWAGLIIASPYIIYEVFAFIAPGLYENERRITIRAVVISYLLFVSGVLLSYFAIFPITVDFLGSYQVADYVAVMLWWLFLSWPPLLLLLVTPSPYHSYPYPFTCYGS